MKIYLIGGKARNGKDTLASFMKEYYEKLEKKVCIMHIANYIKHFAIDYFGWDGKEETKPRSLLQELGTDLIRNKMNKPYFFTRRIIEDMEVLEHFFDVIIISDVRFPLEFDEIQKAYPTAIKIHITRPDLVSELSEKEKNHPTETALEDYDLYDYKIVNKDLESLKKQAEKIVLGGMK